MAYQYIESGTTHESSEYCRGLAIPGAFACPINGRRIERINIFYRAHQNIEF
jgi:hypothetical protein